MADEDLLFDQAVGSEEAYDVTQAVHFPTPSMGEVVKSVPGVAQGIGQESLGGGIRAVGDVIGSETVADIGAGIAESGVRNVEAETLPGMSLGQQFVQSGGANVLVAAPAIALGATFGVPAALTGIGATTFGSTYNQSREAQLGVGRSLFHGAVDAAIEAGTEYFAAKYLFGSAGGPTLRDIGKALVADYGGEIAATLLQDLNAKASYRPDLTLRDVVDDTILTAGSMLVAGPLTAGLGAGLTHTVRGLRKLQAKGDTLPSSSGVATPPPVVPTLEPALSTGIQEQNPAVVSALPVEALAEQDLQKSQWVQTHAEKRGYRETGVAIMEQDPATKPIPLATRPELVGKQLGAVEDLKGGDVVVAGELWEGHPQEYMQVVMEEIQHAVQNILGNKVAVVLATGLMRNKAGVAATAFATDGTPIAFVNPRHVYETMLSRKAEGKTSLHAESEAQYSLYHEIGHVIEHFLVQNATPAQRQALADEFRVAAEGVANGTMPAVEFVQKYMSPWKIAKGFAMDDYGGKKGEWSPLSAQRFVQYVVSRPGTTYPPVKDVSGVTAKTFLSLLAKKGGMRAWTDVFNFQEFVAEQHARWMRNPKRQLTSPIGQFFGEMNTVMSQYFNWLVRSKKITRKELNATEAYSKFIRTVISKNKKVTEPVMLTKEELKKSKNAAVRKGKIYYDLNEDGSEGHNAMYAGVPEHLLTNPTVVKLAARWQTAYGHVTKSPFFHAWGGNWELEHAVSLMHTDTSDAALGRARNEVRKQELKLVNARNEAVREGAPKEIIEMLDKLRSDIPRALRGEYPEVWIIRDPTTHEPKQLYHGVWDEFEGEEFLERKRGTGVGGADTEYGWFVTDNPNVSATYVNWAMPGGDPYEDPQSGFIMPIYLRMYKPVNVGHPDSGVVRSYDSYSYTNAMQIAHEQNRGGAIIHDVVDGGMGPYADYSDIRSSNVYIFRRSSDAKSAWRNMGTFSAKSNNIHWDTGSVVAQGDEGPLRKAQSAGLDIPIADLKEAGQRIRHKLWIVEQLRAFGLDLGTWEVNLLQWQHIAKRLGGLPFVQRFVDLSRAYTENKHSLVKYPSESAVNAYKQLGKTQIDQLRRIMEFETDEGVHLTEVMDGYLPDGRPAKIRSIADMDSFRRHIESELGFVPDELTLDYYQRFRTSMHNQLLELQNAAMEKAQAGAELSLEMLGEFGDLFSDAKMEDIQQLQDLLDKPQYPWSRFGRYALIVKQEVVDEKGKKTQKPVHYRHFENVLDRNKAYDQMTLQKGESKETFDYHNDYTGFSVIPQSFVEVVIQRAGFDTNSADADKLRQLAAVQRNTNLFKRFEEDFKLTDRTEHDIVKDFADFSGHLAALTAKVRYRRQLSLTLADAQKAINRLNAEGINSEDLQTLRHYMKQQLDYGMTPQDELQSFRNIVMKSMLFGNVRAASMNLTAILNTASYVDALISKYNVLSWPSMVKVFTTVIKDVASLSKTYDALTPDERTFLQDLEGRGVTDQSYAYHLAAAADSGAYYRLTHSKSKWGTKIVETGMLPFRFTERYGRRTGALVAYRMAKTHPEILNGKTPAEFAQDAMELTQGDYTAMNRPRSQQGLKSAALIFFTYTQTMATIFGGTLGGATSARLFLVYTMLGGLMGLPFAEDLINLSNWVWRRLFKGEEDLRVVAHQVAAEIPYIGPHLLRGVMHNIGGFDLSQSISLGRIVPGMDAFAKSNYTPVDEAVGAFMFDLLGPMGGYVRGYLQAGSAMLQDPSGASAIRLLQAAMPAQRHAFDLMLYQLESGDPSTVRGYAGQVITKEADGTVRPLTTKEMFGKALGFNPGIISVNRETDFLQREVATYWTQRRKRYMDEYWQAHLLRDVEMKADVRNEIRNYNNSVPDRALKITSKDIARSRKQRERIRKLEERGSSPVKRYRTLYRRVEEVAGPQAYE